MKVTTYERWTVVMALAAAAIGCLTQASNEAYGWYFVAVVFIAFAWLVLQLPTREPELVAGGRVADAAPGLYSVAVQFVGEAPLVFERLISEGWTIGGAGWATAKAPGVAILEVSGAGPDAVRHAAERAVRQTGCAISGVGPARRIK